MKKVIIGTMSYQNFVTYLRPFINELNLIHISNFRLPDTHIISQKIYDGILVCEENDVALAKKCIKDANDWVATNKKDFNLNIVEYDEPKIFDLLSCRNSDKYSTTGYVKNCIKAKENCRH